MNPQKGPCTMRHRLTDPELQQSVFDVAMIRIDRCNALATLLAIEDVASAFADLSAPEQAAYLGPSKRRCKRLGMRCCARSRTSTDGLPPHSRQFRAALCFSRLNETASRSPPANSDRTIAPDPVLNSPLKFLRRPRYVICIYPRRRPHVTWRNRAHVQSGQYFRWQSIGSARRYGFMSSVRWNISHSQDQNRLERPIR